MPSSPTTQTLQIKSTIQLIRDQKIILDRDLAELYGVTTKRLNEQVKRNRERFPEDFMFQLSAEEKEEVVANCDHLEKLKFSPALPYAFTEHGALMVANVLHSTRAIQVSIQIVRTFVQLRKMLLSYAELSYRMDKLEEGYDTQFKIVFDEIRKLMTPEKPKNDRPLGFRVDEAV